MDKKDGVAAAKLSGFFLTFILFLSSNLSVIASEKKEIVFGVLPIVSTQKLIARLGPLADYISEKTGIPVRLETAPDFATFMQRTNKQKRYDLIFTAPHFYYLAQRQAGYKVIVRVAAPEMRAVIVAPKESNIRKLQDLKGKTLSVTDSLALATLMVRAHLSKSGLDPDKDLTLVNTPTHNASLISAVKGITDAASLMQPPYNRAKKSIKQEMRLISVTEGSPHMPIAVTATLDHSIVNKITNALLQLKSNDKGKALLKHLRWPGFIAVKPADYDKLKWAVKEIR